MRKIWSSYSYTILFIAGILFVVYATMSHFTVNPADTYRQVVIEKGDTVWDIAKKIENPDMNQTEIIKWIQQNNDIDITQIKAGESILIPIEKQTNMLQLADIDH